MTELPPEVEQTLADMSSADWNALVMRCRPPEDSVDPKVRAALALQNLRGRNMAKPAQRIDNDNPAPSSKQEAVAALRAMRGIASVTTEDDD
jgi:hypothetical protein